MLAIRTIPTIPAVFAGRGPRPARRLAQDSPTSPVLRKDWRPAICAVAARIPRYAIARPAACPDCTPPAASMELGETADPPAVSAAVGWYGGGSRRVRCARCARFRASRCVARCVRGLRFSWIPSSLRNRLLCRHLSCRRASRAAPYACYALRSYSSLLPSIARM